MRRKVEANMATRACKEDGKENGEEGLGWTGLARAELGRVVPPGTKNGWEKKRTN